MTTRRLNTHAGTIRAASPLRAAILAAAAGAFLAVPSALAQISDENPPVMLQWFECRWEDMERRMPDFFVAGYGRTWLPPVSRGYVWPGSTNQNSDSAGYDTFDRFNLGTPNAQTAYGTESGFDAVRDEFHRANAEVYVDMVLNHNAGRQTGAGFMEDGGYPGFWMNPPTPMRDKLPTDDWGDFHGGVAGGYLQSTNPNDPRYCLLRGDLVALVDIDPTRDNVFIRQPVEAGNPLNLPAGRFFNRPDPNNRRFYPDTALGTDTVNNPGMSTGAPWLNSGIFAPPCDVPGRNEPASSLTMGRFNLNNPMAGDPIPENSTGYLLRWTQWMLDVKKVDGFRIDAIKHVPSWFWDTYYDTVVHNRRITPDGRLVTPYSFGECVDGNDFCFDRYIRMPNGRGASGRNANGDAFGNRDALDLSGAGAIRDLMNGQPWASWGSALATQLDATDDGFQNGSIGVRHTVSHDNGTWGDGNSQPIIPPTRNLGYFAHAAFMMLPGQFKVFHNARGIPRTGGFWPREGIPTALGFNPSTTSLDNTMTTIVQAVNHFGRGWYYPRWTDSEVHLFERATPQPGGGLRSNVIVGANRSYTSGVTDFDARTFNSAFPQGTRLVEYSGNWNNPAYAAGTIPRTIDVGANGQVTVRVPRNVTFSGNQHHRGFVFYAPAIPEGTLSFTNVTRTINPDANSTPDSRQRLTPIPLINANTFRIVLTTSRGEFWHAPTNDSERLDANANADDNAVFRINQGFTDFNGNGFVDIDHQNSVVPGYEQFVTLREPLHNSTRDQGRYEQEIDASTLEEGINYVSVAAFRRRPSTEAPLFRDFRAAIYVDRLPPQALTSVPSNVPLGTVQLPLSIKPADRTVNRVHVLVNPPVGTDPRTLATLFNRANRVDRFDWSWTASGLVPGNNRIVLVAFEESGSSGVTTYEVFVGTPPCPCTTDYNNSGSEIPDIDDILAFFNDFNEGNANADVNCTGEGSIPDIDDILTFFDTFTNGC